jgi:hypothetical protein
MATKFDSLETLSEKQANELLARKDLQRECSEKSVDFGMLVSNLKLSVSERIEKLQQLLSIQCEIRGAKWNEPKE